MALPRELRSVSGKLLIKAFRFSKGWGEYANDIDVVFGVRQDESLGGDFWFFAIRDSTQRVPAGLLRDLGNSSGLGLEGLAALVSQFRSQPRDTRNKYAKPLFRFD